MLFLFTPARDMETRPGPVFSFEPQWRSMIDRIVPLEQNQSRYFALCICGIYLLRQQ